MEKLQRALAAAELLQHKVHSCPAVLSHESPSSHGHIATLCEGVANTCWWLQDQVARKVALTEDKLQEAVEDIRRAAAEAYPGGLPAEEPFKHALDGTEDPIGTSVSVASMHSNIAAYWLLHTLQLP